MIEIKQVESKSFARCCCCQESIRKCEQSIQVFENGKKVRGETYCLFCRDYAYQNNPEVCDSQDDFAYEREREAYAGYDNKQNFWNDKNAGLI